jgi:hypothetical protein
LGRFRDGFGGVGAWPKGHNDLQYRRRSLVAG